MIKGLNVLGLIPARGGSMGIPRKNVKLLNCKPLIAYTIEAAISSKYIDRTVVSTEERAIANLAKSYGAEVPVLRPKEFATDNSHLLDSVVHMVNYLQEKENFTVNLLVILLNTYPFRDLKDIDEALEKLVQSGQNCLNCISPIDSQLERSAILEDGRIRLLETIPGNFDLYKKQIVYKITSPFAIFRKPYWEDYDLERNGQEFLGYKISKIKAIDLDEEIDFKLAEALMKRKSTRPYAIKIG